jgi:type IV fimbrial biogenesis protein FimT
MENADMNAQGPGMGSRLRPPRGLTLIELMATLAIAAVLLGVGLPGIGKLLAATHANSSMMQLRALLGFARQSAITMNREVTLCGTTNGTNCSNRWEANPTLVFIDGNGNRRADPGERILVVSELTRAGRIRWSASGNRSYLRYRSNGGVAEFGNFTYCPENRNPRYARQLILAATGRPRSATDANGDGIVEDRTGAPLSCDW